ncbi:MAG: hypothetical protein ACRCXD_02750, partial [Luteolibacter sp.]
MPESRHLMIQKLHAILGEIASRRKRQRFHGGLALIAWIGFFISLLCWVNGVPLGNFLPVLLVVLGLSAVSVFLWSRHGLSDPRQIAKDIERKHPALQTSLLAALDQSPDPASGTLGFLQNRLVLDSLASAQRDHWLDLIPRPRLTGLAVLHLVGVFLCIITLCLMSLPRSLQ